MIKHYFHKVVDGPVDEVYRVFRDRQVEMNLKLPGVAGCRVVNSEKKDEVKNKIVLEMKGKTNIPGFLKPFLNDDSLIWRNHQEWDDMERTCSYYTEAVYFRDSVDASGIWKFSESRAGLTDIYINSMIDIDTRGISGLPDQLVEPASRIVEDILHRISRPNLNRVIKYASDIVKEDLPGNGQ